MTVSTAGAPTLCRRCGQISVSGGSGTCPHCGSPLTGTALLNGTARLGGPAVSARRLAGAQAPPLHSFDQPTSGSGPRLSRRSRLAIGVSSVAVLALVVAFLVLRPEPPSPAGAVRDYFARLGSGDTAAALELVDTGGISLDQAPLLVPAALQSAANRPTDVTIVSTRAYAVDDRYTAVTVGYQIGEQAVEQPVTVVATGEETTPYRLQQPFLYLTVEMPSGLNVAVNGITVDPATVARGTPAFPGAYQATSTGNALFAGATQAATYTSGTRGVAAEIDLAQAAIAPSAVGAVQKAVERYLDDNCVSSAAPLSGYRCPLREPFLSLSQATTWTIAVYPQIELSAVDPGSAQVRFTTGTSGSAGYAIIYTDFSGAQKTETGTVPIDISGGARIDDNGAIEIALGY